MYFDDLSHDQVTQCIIVHSSETGGPCLKNNRIVFIYVKRNANATFFLTTYCDRPDITSRVFHLKVKEMITFSKLGKLADVAYLNSIEFQKRGLSYAHILIWLIDGKNLRTNGIGEIICAEILYKNVNPILFDITYVT